MTRRRGPPADSAMLSDAERASRLVGELTREVDEILQGTTSLSVKAHDAPGPLRHRGRSAPRRPRHRRRPALRRAAPRSGGRDARALAASTAWRARAPRASPRADPSSRAWPRAARDLKLDACATCLTRSSARPRPMSWRTQTSRRARRRRMRGRRGRGGPPQPPLPAPPHRTTVLRPPPPAVVPSLANLALATLATHADAIADVSPLDEICATALLREIMRRGKLTTPIARVFIGSGHQELSEAVSQLNLFAGIRPGTGFAPRARPFPG